jgi:hypothetical protein
MTESDIAWACGLFEGEGSVFLNPRKHAFACITMTDPEPVRAFHQIIGFGSLDGPFPPPKSHPTWKKKWRWRSGDRRNIERLLELFKSRLSPRRLKQFETVLRDCKVKNRLPTSPECGAGTYSGYARHRERKEAPCEPCRVAFRKYMKEWRARKKALIVGTGSGVNYAQSSG